MSNPNNQSEEVQAVSNEVTETQVEQTQTADAPVLQEQEAVTQEQHKPESEQPVNTIEREGAEAEVPEGTQEEAPNDEASEETAENTVKKIPLLDRMVKRLYTENGETKEEYKKVQEIISPNPIDGDVWETPEGKVVISHIGIEKLADFIGAEWEVEEVDDKPNTNNDKGYYIRMKCIFPDGTVGRAVGSANDKNATSKISNEYKYEMAYKRAQDRSFLNNRYTKMYDVYSAGESDSWSKEEMLKHQIAQKDKQIKHIIADGKAKISHLEQEVGRRNRFIDKLLAYIALPSDDPNFPNANIQSLVEAKEFDYLTELLKHADKTIAYTAKRLLSLNNITLEEKEAMDQEQAENQTEATPVIQENEAEASQSQKPEDVTSSDNEVAATKQVVNNASKPFVLEPIEEEEYERVNFRLGKKEEAEEE